MEHDEDPKTDSRAIGKNVRATSTRSSNRNDNLFRRVSGHRRSFTATMAIVCCLLFLLSSIPSTRGSSVGNPPPPSGVPNPNPNLDYIYNVSPSLYPSPSYASSVPSSSPLSLVQLVSLPSSATPYGMIDVSAKSTGGSTLWFESGDYNSLIAQDLLPTPCPGQLPSCPGVPSPCSVPSCPTIPVGWNAPESIFSSNQPLVSDASTAVGDTVIAAASTPGTTYLYLSQDNGYFWYPLGTSISGKLESLSANATNVSVITEHGTAWTVTDLTFGGTIVSSSALTFSGPAGTEITSAATNFVTSGTVGYSAIVFSLAGPELDQIRIETSANLAGGYGTSWLVTTFQDTTSSSALSSLGATLLNHTGIMAGEVSLSTSGGELFLAYTSVSGGQGSVETQGSSDDGRTWTGPYASEPPSGAVANLTLTGSPAGLVYATWRTLTSTAGEIGEAAYFPDGQPLVLPTLVPNSPNASEVTGPPTIIVDALQRPMIAWPTSNGSGSFVAVTGDFLSPGESLTLLNQVLTDPLSSSDFSSPGSQPAFNSSTSSSLTSISGNWNSGQQFSAQDTSALTLYPEVTHIPLEVINGLGTTSGFLSPGSTSSSPVVNSTGVDSPNVFLAVYADWLLESEAVPLMPDIFGGNSTSLVPLSLPVVKPSRSLLAEPVCLLSPVQNSCDLDVQYIIGAATQSLVTGYSPTTITVDPSVFVGGPQAGGGFHAVIQQHCGGPPPGFGLSTFWIQSNVNETWVNVSINGSPSHSFVGSGSGVPWAYVTNLTPNTQYSYEVTITSALNQSNSGNWCTTDNSPPSVVITPPLVFTGSVKTQLSMESPEISVGNDSVTFGWWTTLQARGTAQVEDLNHPADTWTLSTGTYYTSISGRIGFTGIVGDCYEVTLTATSRLGGWTSSEQPAYSYLSYGQSPAQTATKVYGSTGCSIRYGAANVHMWALSVANVFGTTAAVSWSANVNSPGYVVYSPVGSASTNFIGNLTGTRLSNGTAWSYTVELHGLEPWTNYAGTFGVLYSVPTYIQNVSASLPTFQTVAIPTTWEQDLPYDSISHTGSGAAIEWSVPSAFMEQTPTPQVTGGTVWVWNSSATELIPISPLELVKAPGSLWPNQVNITLSGFNQTYGFILQLNYSGSPAVSATSTPTYFTFQLDSSGDGLTNLEKELGWMLVDPSGGGIPVMANPAAYSTNGLVSDYLEKEYDLDPLVVDSRYSHMLDTWNLTFSLANDGGTIPGNFMILDEPSSYNPFASTVQYAPGKYETGSPTESNLNNISANPANGITSGDGSPQAATYLWTFSALQTFLSLPGVVPTDPLRAVEGSYGGTLTLTVWGKLSWGADPDTASTPGDGIADGSRINPLYTEGLSVHISDLYVGRLNSAWGYAALLQPYAGISVSGAPELSNFSAPAGAGLPRLSNYTVVLPVSQTSQYQTLELEVLANESGSRTLSSIDFNNLNFGANVTYDMFSGLPLVETFTGHPSGGAPNGTLDLTIQAVPLGEKAPTYLWLPTDNSTVNGLPVGLERYTGEQSFDLVVVNASTAFTSVSIPLPWGSGTYTIGLQRGLNNLLLPREQFLNSSFAEAIFGGKSLPYPGSDPTPPVLSSDSSAQRTLTADFGSSTPYIYDLAAYWQNRSVSANPGNLTRLSKPETGIPGSSSLQIQVLAVQTASTKNYGGLQSDPTLYTSGDTPPALQAIVALNITSQSSLDLLLSALLTNTTGSVNGTLQTVTSQAYSLSLDPAVLSSLANVAVVGQGVFGPPPYSHQSSSKGVWGEFWNAVTSVMTNPLGTIYSLGATVWNAGVAAYAYFNQLGQAILTLGGQLLGRVAGTLVSVGKMVVSALNVVLQYIISFVRAALAIVINPIIDAAKSFDSALGAATNATVSDVTGRGSVTTAHGMAWAQAFDQVAILGCGLGAVVAVAITLSAPFQLGAGFLLALIVGLLPTIASQLIAGFPFGMTTLTQSAVVALGNSMGNPLSGTAWTAAAESVGIVVPSGDFLFAMIKGSENSFPEAAALSLVTTMIVDVIVGLFNVVTWFIHTSAMVITALILAGFAAGISVLDYPKYAAFPELGTFAEVSRLLGVVGAGVAGADLALAEA
jgi:hypothetical protein